MPESFHVLHVDDEPDFLDLAKEFLERQDPRLSVDTATSVDAAHGILEEQPIDCIVSDYDMPGLDGLEFLQQIREEYSNLPFILFTGKGSEEIASDAIAAGVTDYVQKGSTEVYELLANRIINAIDRSSHREKIRELHDVAVDLDSYSTVEAVCQRTIDAAEHILEFNSASMSVFNPLTETFTIVAVSKTNPFENDKEFPAAGTLAERTRQKEETIVISDTSDIEHVRGDVSDSIVSLPVTDRLMFQAGAATTDAFDAEDIDLIELLAAHAESAIDRIRRERELRHERDRFESLFETLPEPAVLVGGEERINSTISQVNTAFEDVFGYEENEIVDAHLNDVIVPDNRLEEAQQIDQENLEGNLRPREVKRETADGELRDFLLLTTQLEEFGDDDIAEAFAIYADITDQKEREAELSRQRDRFELLFETLPEPTVFVKGEDSPHIIDVNSAFEDVFGYDSDEISGDNLNDLIVPPDQRDSADQIDTRVSQGEYFTEEVQRQTADGERRDFLLIVSDRRFPDGTTDESEDPEGFVIYADITDRKESQRELQREKERLERFASILSHDLRNPLRVAEGNLELLKEKCDSKRIEAVGQAHERMNELIENILTMARQGDSVSEVESIELSDLAAECWQTVETRDATIDNVAEQVILGDETRVRQIIENLFRNAIEHGGRDVTVTVGDLPDGFYIEDDGGGIPTDDWGDIFERGYSTADENTGFGLTIVNEIVEAHDWKIQVTESSDGGARFEITGVNVGSSVC